MNETNQGYKFLLGFSIFMIFLGIIFLAAGQLNAGFAGIVMGGFLLLLFIPAGIKLIIDKIAELEAKKRHAQRKLQPWTKIKGMYWKLKNKLKSIK